MHLLDLLLSFIPGYKKLTRLQKLFGISIILLSTAAVSYARYYDFLSNSQTAKAVVVSQRVEGSTYFPTYAFEDKHGAKVVAEESSWLGAQRDQGTKDIRPFEIGDTLIVRFRNDDPHLVTDTIYDDPMTNIAIGLPGVLGGLSFLLWTVLALRSKGVQGKVAPNKTAI